MFDPEDNDDADFNKLALFILWEKNKGKKSFWYPFFQVVEFSYTLYDWKKQEVKHCQDEWTLNSVTEFRKGMEQTWDEFKSLFKKYPQFFPKGTYPRETFSWAYQLVMTRCYGWTMHSTSIVPFADMLNHSKYSTDHLIYNSRFEKLGSSEKVPKEYNLKEKAYDFQILKEGSQNPGGKGEEYRVKFYENPIADYVEEHRKDPELRKGRHLSRLPEFLEDRLKDELQDSVREINLQRLRRVEDENVWDLPFFSTSDSEDNDTESDEEENKSIERNHIMHEVKIQESLELDALFQKLNLSGPKKLALEKIQQSKSLELERYKKKNEKSKNYLNEQDWEVTFFVESFKGILLIFILFILILNKSSEIIFFCGGGGGEKKSGWSLMTQIITS